MIDGIKWEEFNKHFGANVLTVHFKKDDEKVLDFLDIAREKDYEVETHQSVGREGLTIFVKNIQNEDALDIICNIK